jgi:hypothetical protein
MKANEYFLMHNGYAFQLRPTGARGSYEQRK